MTALRLLRQQRERRRSAAVRVFYANSVEDIQSEVLRCAEEGERLRPIGGRRGCNALSDSDENWLSLERLRGAELAQIEKRRMWVRPGTSLHDLIGWLSRHDLGLDLRPDYPGQTLGAAISTGSPARLADYVVGLRIVHSDGHRTSYSVERERSLFDAMRVSLGAMGVITQIELLCADRRRGAPQRRQASFGEALRVLEADDAVRAGQSVIWFANAPALIEYWDESAEPRFAEQLYDQARSLLHDAVGAPLLCGLAASLPAGPRWSDTIGANIAGASDAGLLPLGGVRTARRIQYSIPAGGAAEFLLRLRDLWRSLHFPVYAPVRVEFAPADPGWLSPAYGRDSALVSFPYTPATAEEFIESMIALLGNCGGRPCWAHLHRAAPPPTAADYPRLADFAALRRKIDRHGVFLNRYLSALFGSPYR